MAVFYVEKNRDHTVISNRHLSGNSTRWKQRTFFPLYS